MGGMSGIRLIRLIRLFAEPCQARTARLSGNSCRDFFFVDARMSQVVAPLSRERCWGSDGASLESVSAFSQDPAAIGMNLYEYVGDDPLTQTDPSGLGPETDPHWGLYPGWQFNPRNPDHSPMQTCPCTQAEIDRDLAGYQKRLDEIHEKYYGKNGALTILDQQWEDRSRKIAATEKAACDLCDKKFKDDVDGRMDCRFAAHLAASTASTKNLIWWWGSYKMLRIMEGVETLAASTGFPCWNKKVGDEK
jgi:hypothetical protein